MTYDANRLSQSGYDVKTATVQQLSLTDQFFHLKIKAQGQTTMDVPDDGALHTTNIAHGLSYRPAFLVLGAINTANLKRWTLPVNTSEWSLETMWARADGTNLTIGAILNAGPGTKTFSFYYYIFYEKGGA